jgi:ABC-type nitrate/sulfonate/bicarbonate transport system substrate-binding protein
MFAPARSVLLALVPLALVACAGTEPVVPEPTPPAAAAPDDAPVTEPAPDPVELSMIVLDAPSLTSFLGPIIESQGFDAANGLDLTFVAKPPPAARADFAADPTVLSATATYLNDVLLVNERGVDVVMLFNTFEFWGTVVVEADSDIESLADLEGRDLVGSLATANFAMFQMLAERSGVDLERLTAQNADTPGLLAAAQSGNFDAVQLWEPAHSVLMASDAERFRALDVVGPWREATGLDRIPYIGVAAHREWYEQNPELATALYLTFRDAAEFVRTEPSEAARIVSEATSIDVAVLEDLLASDRFGFEVFPATENIEAFEPLSEAAFSIGLTERVIPPAEVIVPIRVP